MRSVAALVAVCASVTSRQLRFPSKASASQRRPRDSIRKIVAGQFPGAWPGEAPLFNDAYTGVSMSSHDDENREPEPVGPGEEEDAGFTGGGGAASVIYGDGEDDKADETAEEMLKAPDESD
jgi:hypothetical protein